MSDGVILKEDKVNHPKHYTNGDIEPIDYINGNKMDYLEGNIIKYISRYKYKNGIEEREDETKTNNGKTGYITI